MPNPPVKAGDKVLVRDVPLAQIDETYGFTTLIWDNYVRGKVFTVRRVMFPSGQPCVVVVDGSYQGAHYPWSLSPEMFTLYRPDGGGWVFDSEATI
jgi:hypothetical protein